MVFGSLLHATLCTAMKLQERGVTVDRQMIESLWEVEWRTGASFVRLQRRDLYSLGRSMLRRYVASPLFTDAVIMHVPVTAPNGAQADSGPMLEFGFRLDEGNPVVLGRFDRVDVRNGVPVVVDYKTGDPREGINRHREQLLLYAVAISDLTGVAEVTCEIHWLRNASVASIHFSNAEIVARRQQAIEWAVRNPPTADHNGPPGPRARGQERGYLGE